MSLNSLFSNRVTTKDSGDTKKDIIITGDDDLYSLGNELYVVENLGKLERSDDFSFTDKNSVESVGNIILDFRDNDDLVKNVDMITNKLDVRINIIVLGSYDSIRIKNKVQSLGANYVLYDDELEELFNCIQELSGKQTFLGTQGKARQAKRILFLSTKGGIGLSTISSIVTHALSTKAKVKALYVDFDSNSTNCDIILGVKGFRAKQNSIDLNQEDFDSSIARSYLGKVNENLDILTLENINACHSDYEFNLLNLSNTLTDDYNFIIDSVPTGSIDALNDDELKEKYHKVFVLVEPSVASLRAYNLLKKKLFSPEHQVIISTSRPTKDYLVSIANAKDKIKVQDALEIGYEAGLENQIISGGIESIVKGKLYTSCLGIVSDLTGKDLLPKKKWSLRRKKKVAEQAK